GGAVHGSLQRQWVPHRGALEHAMSHEDFYRLVGRPDLAAEHHHRQHIAAVAGTMSVVLIIPIAVFFFNGVSQSHNCSLDSSSSCLEDAARNNMIPAGLFAGASLISAGVSVYYAHTADPISEEQAKGLADHYNDGLRRSLGLPVVSDVHVAPYASASGGGLAL